MSARTQLLRTTLALAALTAITAGSALPAAATPAPAPAPASVASAVATAAESGGELFPELNGWRIRAAGSDDVYIVLDGMRRLIPSSVTYNALFSGTDGIRQVLTVDNIADGGPLTAYAYLARTADAPTVHLVSNGVKREITPAAMDKFGFDPQKVRITYAWVLAGLPSAAPLT